MKFNKKYLFSKSSPTLWCIRPSEHLVYAYEHHFIINNVEIILFIDTMLYSDIHLNFLDNYEQLEVSIKFRNTKELTRFFSEENINILKQEEIPKDWFKKYNIY